MHVKRFAPVSLRLPATWWLRGGFLKASIDRKVIGDGGRRVATTHVLLLLQSPRMLRLDPHLDRGDPDLAARLRCFGRRWSLAPEAGVRQPHGSRVCSSARVFPPTNGVRRPRKHRRRDNNGNHRLHPARSDRRRHCEGHHAGGRSRRNLRHDAHRNRRCHRWRSHRECLRHRGSRRVLRHRYLVDRHRWVATAAVRVSPDRQAGTTRTRASNRRRV